MSNFSQINVLSRSYPASRKKRIYNTIYFRLWCEKTRDTYLWWERKNNSTEKKVVFSDLNFCIPANFTGDNIKNLIKIKPKNRIAGFGIVSTDCHKDATNGVDIHTIKPKNKNKTQKRNKMRKRQHLYMHIFLICDQIACSFLFVETAFNCLGYSELRQWLRVQRVLFFLLVSLHEWSEEEMQREKKALSIIYVYFGKMCLHILFYGKSVIQLIRIR